MNSPKTPTTTTTQTFSINDAMADTSEALFCVRDGVPIHRALDQLTALLAAVSDSLEFMAMAEGEAKEPSPLWCLVYNLVTARALVQAVHKGCIESTRAEPA